MDDIESHGDRAGWRRLADQLREDMRVGELRPGDRLPSEEQLRQTTGFSRSTVRTAIQLLQGEGLVEVRPPRGVFVRRLGDRVVLGPGESLILPAATTIVRANGVRETVPGGTVVAGDAAPIDAIDERAAQPAHAVAS